MSISRWLIGSSLRRGLPPNSLSNRAALAAYHIHGGQPRRIDNRLDGMSGAYLGPAYDADSIRASLDSHRAHYQELEADALDEEVAAAIDQEKVVGWFQGRMEFGPRALGNRSILAKATSPKMQSLLNLKIKYRESFRPFAPAVLRDDLAEWFEMDVDSPYMLLVAGVAERPPPQVDRGGRGPVRHR
jgi:carbamoyltransferase